MENKMFKEFNVECELSKQIIDMLKENQIENLRITSAGNSIASGYSIVRSIKPLFHRSALNTIANENDMIVDIHHFARAQGNCDEHVFDWLISNIKESEIHKMNQNDYCGGLTSMPTHGLGNDKINEYYPIDMKNDKGFSDLVLESYDTLANILVYNGGTGSFLDNWTRSGRLVHRLTYGIKRDVKSLEATLKYIQLNNRKNDSNTQVYLCGVPNFLGLGISEFINSKLKKLETLYANVTYVEPIKSKVFYDKYNEKGKAIDIHYSEVEYLKFISKILKSIKDNYLINKVIINMDRDLYKLSSKIELSDEKLFYLNESCGRTNINVAMQIDYVNSNNNLIVSKMDIETKETLYKKAKQYIANRFSHDFYYLGKDNINNVLKMKLK